MTTGRINQVAIPSPNSHPPGPKPNRHLVLSVVPNTTSGSSCFHPTPTHPLEKNRDKKQRTRDREPSQPTRPSPFPPPTNKGRGDHLRMAAKPRRAPRTTPHFPRSNSRSPTSGFRSPSGSRPSMCSFRPCASRRPPLTPALLPPPRRKVSEMDVPPLLQSRGQV